MAVRRTGRAKQTQACIVWLASGATRAAVCVGLLEQAGGVNEATAPNRHGSGRLPTGCHRTRAQVAEIHVSGFPDAADTLGTRNCHPRLPRPRTTPSGVMKRVLTAACRGLRHAIRR